MMSEAGAMSVELVYGRSAELNDDPNESVRVGDASSPLAAGRPVQGVVAGAATDTVEALLSSVARGDRTAVVALQSRMTGLVRVNVRRVLRNASRADAVSQEVFAELLEDAACFDPRRDSAQMWLLARAHQRAMDGLGSIDGTDARSVSGSLP